MNPRLELTRQLCRAGVLFAPASFMTASLDRLNEVCNGCGAADARFDFVPDRIYGTYIGHACEVHDWMYNEGRTIEDKDEADRVMLNNMLRLINRDSVKWYKPTGLQRIRARRYYGAVQCFGGPAFWAGKN